MYFIKTGVLQVVSPDGTKVLSGGSDFTARVYNINTKALLCTFD
jgi:WD40 repeat protein